MKKILLGACALVLMTGFATAQTATDNPPPPAQDQQIDGADSQGGGWFSGGRHGRHHGQKGYGRHHGGGRGGHIMQIDGKGFGLMLGPGHGLRINCGDEAMKDCIAAAQPLIDALGKLDFKMPPSPAAPAP